MKRFILLVIFIFTIIFNVIPENEVHQDDELQRVICNIQQTWKKEKYLKNFEIFLDSLSMRESSMNPDTFNTLGFIGEFQFGKAALKDIGLKHITFKKFKENPKIFPKELQRIAIIKFMKLNYSRIKLKKKYLGKIIKGIKITESSLLVGCHLGGPGGVNRFLQSNGDYDPCDAYGTKISDYMKEFNKYNIKLEFI